MHDRKLATFVAPTLASVASPATAKTMIDYFQPIPIIGTIIRSGWGIGTSVALTLETDDLELRAADPNSCLSSDEVHSGTAGQLELGKRMATKVHDKL